MWSAPCRRHWPKVSPTDELALPPRWLRGISIENIAIAVATTNQALLSRISVAQAQLEASGALPQIRRAWPGNPDAGQSSAVL
jgi:predicted RNA polymerase sigma factor